MNRLKNEWDLFLLVQQRLDAGAAREVSFDILGPSFWTIFSRRPAQVRGDEGTEYDLGPDFPEVMHALMRVNIDSGLIHHLPEYRLHFRPGKHHPHYDPARRRDEAAAPGLGLGSGVSLTSTSPDALRNFLDRLPPAPPAESDNESEDEEDR